MNDREVALAGLRSSGTSERLEAARYFAAQAASGDTAMLRSLLATETVPWIRRALELAIKRSGRPQLVQKAPRRDPAAPFPVVPDGIETTQLIARATEQATDQLLHEIAPLIASIKLSAAREWEDFGSSTTAKTLDQATRLMKSLRELNQASETPRFESLTLSVVVHEVIATNDAPPGVRILTEGPAHLMVEADRGKLEIAISNGLRNAIEAVSELLHVSGVQQISLAWGATAEEVWLVIKDTGPGFGGNPESFKRRGVTGKPGHPGHGLSLAARAMESMDGEILVKNLAPGAHFELRWYRRNADSGR